MQFGIKLPHRNTPDADLIADVCRVACVLNADSLTLRQYDEHGNFHSSTVQHRFGGWNKALGLAGLQVGKRHDIPTEEFFRNLEEVWIKLGRQPKYIDLKEHGSVRAKTYVNRFGSWAEALREFSAFINDEPSGFRNIPAPATENALVKQRGRRDVNWRIRFLVMRRDNFRCVACGRNPATDPSVTLDIDHVVAWSKGGATVSENLQTLCTKCNIGKSDLDYTQPA